MKRLAEPSWVYDEVVGRTGLSKPFVVEAIRDLRHVVDRFLADDICVLAPPLIVRRKGDPVSRSIMDRLKDHERPVPDDLLEMDHVELAATLSLDEDLTDRYRVACWSNVLVGLVDLRGLADDDPVVQDLFKLLEAWLETFGFDQSGSWRREYEMTTAGYERHFEDWAVDHLDHLLQFGYPVELYHRQWRHTGGTADLVCRFVEDAGTRRKGDWLIIENQATMVDIEVLDQIDRFVAAAEAELAVDDAKVFGLLLADGVTVGLQERLNTSEMDYVSLSALGYRDFLHFADPAIAETPEDDLTRNANTCSEPPTGLIAVPTILDPPAGAGGRELQPTSADQG